MSTQRPNLKPTDRNVPAGSNPKRLCSAIEPELALSPTIGDHLTPGSTLASCDQFAEQGGADALPSQAIGDIDRILDREAIGRPPVIGAGISEARDFAARFGDQIGQAEIDRRAAAGQHLLERRRRLLESGERAQDVMGVDVANRRHVGLARGANDGRSARFRQTGAGRSPLGSTRR